MIQITNNLIERVSKIDGINNIYSLCIANKNNYSYTWKLLKQLEEKGLILFIDKKKGRIPKFTCKGKVFINHLNKAYSLINEGDK